MNTPPDIVHESAGVTDPGYSVKTRPFYWSVKRELWENRSIYIAPLIVAMVVLFGFLISTGGLPDRRRTVLLLDPATAHAAIEMPYNVAAIMLIFTAFIVGVFYCLDALHGERRDRSILFWKSLPVSDLTTLLSKATIPLIVLPLVTLDASCHAALDQRASHSSRHESRIDLDEFLVISAMSDPAVRIGRDCPLACADLRLGAVGFRLG